jgi:hypothetical protein
MEGKEVRFGVPASTLFATSTTLTSTGAINSWHDSVPALSQARAVGHDANADESRFLVDPSGAAASGQAFLDKTQQLLGLPGAALDTVDAKFADAMNAYSANHDEVHFGPGSFFGTELRDITFAGERAAAEKTPAAYQVCQADDRRLRARATTDVAEADGPGTVDRRTGRPPDLLMQSAPAARSSPGPGRRACAVPVSQHAARADIGTTWGRTAGASAP